MRPAWTSAGMSEVRKASRPGGADIRDGKECISQPADGLSVAAIGHIHLDIIPSATAPRNETLCYRCMSYRSSLSWLVSWSLASSLQAQHGNFSQPLRR